MEVELGHRSVGCEVVLEQPTGSQEVIPGKMGPVNFEGPEASQGCPFPTGHREELDCG